MAEKMYCENGHGGKGAEPKFRQHGTGSSHAGGERYTQHGKGTSHAGGEPTHQANGGGSFRAKYSEIARKSKGMGEGYSKASQKGNASLEAPKNDRSMLRAGNEHNRA